MQEVYFHVGKRLFDVLSSASALLLLSPLLLIVTILVRLEDGGPALFCQKRSGADEKLFELFKFRSMPVNTADIPSGAAGRLSITRVGRFIRRSNIDELPQLINILRGDMSVVGPRPALPGQTKLLKLRRENGAVHLKPGLTGMAQVNSYDGMPEEEKAHHDGNYAAQVSLLTDMKIILKTFIYLLKSPPVY